MRATYPLRTARAARRQVGSLHTTSVRRHMHTHAIAKKQKPKKQTCM
jgi:hypothetical protein